MISTTKTSVPQRKQLRRMHQGLLSSVCTGLLLFSSTPVLAGPGHSHGGGEAFSGSTGQAKPIELDPKDAAQIGIKVEPVTVKRLAFGIPTTGQIESAPDRKVAVTTPVTGTVIKFFVKPGDTVEAGEPVAILSSPELAQLRTDAQTKQAEAKADLLKAQAAMQRTQQNYGRQNQIAAAEIQQANVTLAFAQERYEKDTKLLERGAIPRRQLLETQEKLAEAKAALAKAESRLSVLEAQEQLRGAQSDMQVAQSRLQLSNETYSTRLRQLGSSANPDGTVTITAPISGTVADREASLGESAADPGKPLMNIVNDSTVLATANVYEKDLDQIRVGQSVRVTVASLPKQTFTGRVAVVGTAVQGQSRSLPVKAELDNPNGALKPGMFARMEIITDRTTAAALAVPREAVVDANGRSLVFIQEQGDHKEEEGQQKEEHKEEEHKEGEQQGGDHYEPVEVTLGRTAGDLIEVKSGLKTGDRVVTQGTTLLYAQSLRGGKAEEGGEPGEEKQASAAQAGLPLPWWLVIPGVVAIAAGTFYLGRRSKPPVILRDPDYKDTDYKPDAK
ncbi:MAG: efflux RND transporter periplasmic adaptor subunit [Leptolyngbyaceae cyanobacterium bins.302]|nr:efflux RND transporter periplasmic adaptor subunit [Leptolyngbyaceae cyanobacterium bins.302]